MKSQDKPELKCFPSEGKRVKSPKFWGRNERPRKSVLERGCVDVVSHLQSGSLCVSAVDGFLRNGKRWNIDDISIAHHNHRPPIRDGIFCTVTHVGSNLMTGKVWTGLWKMTPTMFYNQAVHIIVSKEMNSGSAKYCHYIYPCYWSPTAVQPSLMKYLDNGSFLNTQIFFICYPLFVSLCMDPYEFAKYVWGKR